MNLFFLHLNWISDITEITSILIHEFYWKLKFVRCQDINLLSWFHLLLIQHFDCFSKVAHILLLERRWVYSIRIQELLDPANVVYIDICFFLHFNSFVLHQRHPVLEPSKELIQVYFHVVGLCAHSSSNAFFELREVFLVLRCCFRQFLFPLDLCNIFESF